MSVTGIEQRRKLTRQRQRSASKHTFGYDAGLKKPFLFKKARYNPEDDAQRERTHEINKHRPNAASRPQPSLPKITMRVVDW